MRRYMFVLLLYMLPHLISKVTLSAVFVLDGESVKSQVSGFAQIKIKVIQQVKKCCERLYNIQTV